MADIETRLQALEKRARIEDERWQALFARIGAISSIFTAIGAPICAGNPTRLRAISANLRTYEDAARMQNEHTEAIRQFRHTRKFFELRAKKSGRGDFPPTKNGTPHQKK